MAITHKYTLLCDDVRQENNGKFLIIGLYTPDIVIPAIPFALPALTIFSLFESTDTGRLDFSFRLVQGATIVAGGAGQIDAPRAGTMALPLRLGNVQLASVGSYTFTLEIAGLNEPVTHEFSVILGHQQMGPGASTPSSVH